MATFLSKKLESLDEELVKLRRRGFQLTAEQVKNHYMLVDMKNAIEERSFNVKKLLLSGSRRDLQLAIKFLKMPYNIRQRAGTVPQLVIPLENLSATAVTLIQAIEEEMDSVLYRDEERPRVRKSA